MEKKNGKKSFYGSLQIACKSRGTNISRVLTECGRTNGNMGAWKKGVLPNFEIVIEIAEHLNISLDELCYGPGYAPATDLTDEEKNWLSLFKRIPVNRRQVCEDFLRTHITENKKELYDEGQREWLNIISHIPEDRQQLCKDFIKTHAVIPDKYDDKEKVS